MLGYLDPGIGRPSEMLATDIAVERKCCRLPINPDRHIITRAKGSLTSQYRQRCRRASRRWAFRAALQGVAMRPENRSDLGLVKNFEVHLFGAK